MDKYLYLNEKQMKRLIERAKDLDMVFKQPNEVLRDILGLPPKPKKRVSKLEAEGKPKKKKIRVDEEVWDKWKQLEEKARERATENIFDQLIEELHERSEEKDTHRRRPRTI